MAFSVNQGTQTVLASDTNNGTTFGIVKLDIGAIGTTFPWQGQVTAQPSTNNIGSVGVTALPNLPGGSIVMTNGTLASLPNLPQGSIQVTAGTVSATVGTVPGIGSISNIGSLGVLNAGTLTTIPNIPGGTIGVVSSITTGSIVVTNGTVSSSGTTTGVGSVSNLGSLGMLSAGTITTLSNLTAGTVTVNPFQVTQAMISVGTTGTTGIGTLAAAIGAGTGMYITRFSILAISGTPECILAFGSQTANNQVIAHGLFPAGGGMVSDIAVPDHFGTNNLPLTFQILSGAGTVDWKATYFAGTA